MSNQIKIIECPRDAWQGLPKNMPAEVKADYLRVLIAAGFKHIDAVSFVSRSAVPQMADSELVLEYLDPPDDVEIISIVVNAKGAERAVKTGSVQTLGFPYSVSPTFLQRNQGQTPEEALEELEKIGTLAYKAGMDVVAYISMAFGNPYGEHWDIDEVVAACDLLADNGVTQISLADTVGLATPKQVGDLVADVLAVHEGIEIECICMRGRTRLRRRFARRMRRGVGGSMRRSAGWVGVRLRRMRWWEMLRRRYCWRS
ncbi:hypothetical protein [Tunturiibacter gelidiferens]|uniref:hypothetical protein n=1 Tax=Tunturiibacter gelidiferens TaxID=3069689 RepID=UPI003D9B8C67